MDIEKIMILVELNSGTAHQVLATKENKRLIIEMLGRLEEGIRLTPEIEPINIEFKPKQS